MSTIKDLIIKGVSMKTCYILIIAIIFCLVHCLAYADSIDQSSAVRAIIGEASNQGYTGMLAVSCAIRNRGTLKGVYGLNAAHVSNEPQWVYDLALKAWLQSESTDITGGATHWENVKAFGVPYWAGSMVQVYQYKDQVFYKEQ